MSYIAKQRLGTATRVFLPIGANKKEQGRIVNLFLYNIHKGFVKEVHSRSGNRGGVIC